MLNFFFMELNRRMEEMEGGEPTDWELDFFVGRDDRR